MVSHLGPFVQFKVRDPRPAGTPERRMSRACDRMDNTRPADGDVVRGFIMVRDQALGEVRESATQMKQRTGYRSGRRVTEQRLDKHQSVQERYNTQRRWTRNRNTMVESKILTLPTPA
jgi:hypothetical protein